ncbi:MAG TPA: FAD-dependent oxidoreductase [Methylomirabilota bacterium]|jgi:D-amino-acid dehydrogenase|nr:FAD-dependent oxidoreductase [Methylomirabilota bacterium]
MAFDAAVIGGGLLGTATAYHLVGAGARTLLVDRANVGRATDAGAGILSPETNSRDPEAWFRLAVEAVEYYPSLIDRLRGEQAGDTGYAQCGKLVVAVSDDEIEPFAHARRIVFERQRRRGLPKPADLHEITAADARELFPPLAPVHGAIYSRVSARVDGRLLNRALRTAAEARGLVVRVGSVERLVRDGDTVAGVVIGGETVPAGAVAIAGGAWSDEFARQLGVTIPVAPQRGQIIHLGLHGADTSGWPMINAFRHQYLVAWPDSRVVAGATRETGSGFTPHTTSAGIRAVLDEALRVAPGLANAEIREIRVGLRPLTPDSLPVLGPVPGVSGVFLVTGHGPTGLTLGPYSGKLVADLMLGKAPETDLSPFSVARFASAGR